VREASSAEGALAILASEVPDLVITDMRMGGMDGLALFDAVNRKHPSLPVIILTAHGNIPDAVDATRRGVFSYLTKPVGGARAHGRGGARARCGSPSPATSRIGARAS
jgi:two-component system response regulator GlrR